MGKNKAAFCADKGRFFYDNFSFVNCAFFLINYSLFIRLQENTMSNSILFVDANVADYAALLAEELIAKSQLHKENTILLLVL